MAGPAWAAPLTRGGILSDDVRVRFACGEQLSLGRDADLTSVCCAHCGERRIAHVSAPPPRIKAVNCEASGPLVEIVQS